MLEVEESVKKFEERMVHFQIEIKTIEKCLKEDISSLEKYKFGNVSEIAE